jgi:hypothetical protein
MVRQTIFITAFLFGGAGGRVALGQELAGAPGGQAATVAASAASGAGGQGLAAVVLAGAVAWLVVVGLVMVQFRRQRRLAQQLADLSAPTTADRRSGT